MIGCWEVDGALVDPGPRVLAGDAAGGARRRAAAALSSSPTSTSTTPRRPARWCGAGPTLEVYVHERGAPHLIDPSQLLASAERLYGDAMERLWGEIVPVPEENVQAAGGRRDRARHARRLHPRPRLPPRLLPARGDRHRLRRRRRRRPASRRRTSSSPPPRRPTSTSRPGWTRSTIVEGWRAGAPRRHPLRRDRRRRPSTWRVVRERLREEAELARELDEDDYEQRHRALVASRAATEEAAAELIQCVPPQYQWRGLDRYWRKREEREAAPRLARGG